MSRVYKTYEGGLYFLTMTIVGWIDLFTRKDYAYFVLDNMAYCQKNKGLEIYCYCLMSNHFHLIASAEKGILSDLIRDYKTFTSKELYKMIIDNPKESRKDWMIKLFDEYGKMNPNNNNFQIWQQHNQPVELTDNRMIEQRVDYIHMNPVKAGLVAEPEHYAYSSAFPESYLEVLEL
jgi:putative transposase